MRRETMDIQTKFHVTGTRAVIHAAVRADHGGLSSAIERTDRILAALAKADLIIVPKPTGNAEAVREAVRTGNWTAVSEKDLLAWREAPVQGLDIVLDEEGERAIKAAAEAPVPRGMEILVASERPHGLTDRDHAVLDAEMVIVRDIKAAVQGCAPHRAEELAHEITQSLAKAGFEIRYVPLDLVDDVGPLQQVFAVRIGWPEFTSSTILVEDGADVATVTKAAKLHALNGYGSKVDRERWVAFSMTQRRFLAPDEPAPSTLIVGPYEALVRECRTPEQPKEAADADLKRYQARWENGLRNIVTILHGPSYSFEIDQIVEEVRTLTGIVSRLPDESLRRTEHHSFGEDDPFTTISGDASSVERILDLIEKGEAAVKAEREPEISISLGEDTFYLQGTPEVRKELMQFLLKYMGRFAKADANLVRGAS
ncbi:hypothetical protein [Methylobacterium goesingense]|uniref:Uncharacterized protein n=1 Tax=Methylobacterium goesingense TaxID=243690 RepID=A0ABV2L815_9HYPH|nr:hypothetical protein [Methylobacterium goesingense]GJD72707.1 hypothetical protein CFIICLFH_0927 [Methylobacterium goesingense]